MAYINNNNLLAIIVTILGITLLHLFVSTACTYFTDAQSVGVCYGRDANNLPSEQSAVTLFNNNGITRMRLYDPNPDALQALRGTNIELMLGVPNTALQSLSSDAAAASRWVRDNILSYPDVRFRYIAVGNEVDPNTDNSRYVVFVLPAMRNIHSAIVAANLQSRIKVSTATYTGLLGASFPPSDGAFRENVVEFIRPIISFLSDNNLPMLANIYPYFSYLGTPNGNLAYALFTANEVVVTDTNNGVQYRNLFDAMLDAHYAAQARLGGGRVDIVISESGWPSEGGREATVENAGTYYRNLIGRVRGANGTPANPGRPLETYLFAMFDENLKRGDEVERHFGLFTRDQRPKYQLSFN